MFAIPICGLNKTTGGPIAARFGFSADSATVAAAANPEVAPNLDFMDCGGHGYVVVTARAASLEAELVCIPRPIERAPANDGGPVRYRLLYRSPLWKAGEAPVLQRVAAQGDLPLGA
jgi:alkaline phosphatase D